MSIYSQDNYDRHSYDRTCMSDLPLSKMESKLASFRGCSVVNLGDALIGDEGCPLVADFLRQNTAVRNLNLRGNNISPIGLRSLLPTSSF